MAGVARGVRGVEMEPAASSAAVMGMEVTGVMRDVMGMNVTGMNVIGMSADGGAAHGVRGLAVGVRGNARHCAAARWSPAAASDSGSRDSRSAARSDACASGGPIG